MALLALLFLEEVISWFTYAWWIWLFLLAWWWYAWAREHLMFSPLLTLVVGAILVYFLVLEHPFIGSFTMLSWVLLMSGILWLLPTVGQLFNTFFKKPPQQAVG